MSLPQTCFLQKNHHKRQFQTNQVEYSKMFVFLATHYKQQQSVRLQKLQSIEHKMFHSLLQFQKIIWFHKNLIRRARYKIGLSLPFPALSVIFDLFCLINCLWIGLKDLGSCKCKDQFSEKNTANDRIFMQFLLSVFIIHISIFFYTRAWQKVLNRKLSGKKQVIKDILALNLRYLLKLESDLVIILQFIN